MAYPNLAELIKYHPYHISAFANFADVTEELLKAAIRGEEELTLLEIFKIAIYANTPVTVLTCPHLIMLDKKNSKHKQMVAKLFSSVFHIMVYQGQGNKAVDLFMRYDKRYLEDLKNDLMNGNASYAQYLGVKKIVEQVLFSIKCDNRKIRGLKVV